MHPDYAYTLDNIGKVYCSKGDYDKALKFYFQSLEIIKIVSG
jgi:tetratricopeptide (TPR) repeat protein